MSAPADKLADPRADAVPALDWRRVYVFPTRAGGMFAAVLVLVLLGAINYDNALAYLLCFLLSGLFLVGMLHTFHNLAGLALVGVRVEPVHAGTPARVTLRFDDPEARARYAVTLARLAPRTAWWRRARRRDGIALAALDPATPVTFKVDAGPRGVRPLGRLCLESTFPLGLFRAWAYPPHDAELVVYPAPAGRRPLPRAQPIPGAEGVATGSGVDDFAGLAAYRPGDPPRSIHWQSLARTGEPQVKHFRGGEAGDVCLRFADFEAAADTETRLAQLARWILEADGLGLRYALELPGCHVPAGSGPAHRAYCLERLARHAA